MDNSQTMSLRALSIFETASGSEERSFVNLLQFSSMAPLGGDLGLLQGTGLIIAGSSHEASVMEDRLGVSMLSHSDLLEEHVIPRCPACLCIVWPSSGALCSIESPSSSWLSPEE